MKIDPPGYLPVASFSCFFNQFTGLAIFCAGVGHHNHSWAFDGLRCKKWNVSCEPYGRRWKLGDTVGTLIDMDLLEIRFYLNGEDLGQAFEDFSSHDVFPAMSVACASSS